MIKFGPAGMDDYFKNKPLSTAEFLTLIGREGLNAFEYQCGRGVRTGKSAAEEIGKRAEDAGISLSIHAPYYINMASVEEEKRKNSIHYVLQSMKLARYMGAKRVTAHIGSCAKIDREEAMGLALTTLRETICACDENGFGDIVLCPEFMGKGNQLGNMEEIIRMCKVDDRIIPCIDFGHYNARYTGVLADYGKYREIFDRIENDLGYEKIKYMHVHFSRVEYTKAGEKAHRNYEDIEFGPDFEPFAEQVAKRGLEPTVICESKDDRVKDALNFKKLCEQATAKEMAD